MIDGNSTQGKGKEEKVFKVFASLKWVKHVYLWSRVINITCGSVSSGERVGVIGVAKGGGERRKREQEEGGGGEKERRKGNIGSGEDTNEIKKERMNDGEEERGREEKRVKRGTINKMIRK